MSISLQEEYARRQREAKMRGEAERVRIHTLYPELEQLQSQMARLQAQQLLARLQRDVETEGQCRLEWQACEQRWKAFFAAHPEVDPDYAEPKPFCPICNDVGYVGEQICRCQLEWVVSQAQLDSEERLIARSNFDRVLEEVYPDTEEGRKAVEERRQALAILKRLLKQLQNQQLTKNLYLSGIQGSGKTFLAGCLAHAIREAGIPCLFVSARRYFDWLEEERKLRASYRPDLDRLQTLEMQLKLVDGVQVLILDDLGEEADVMDLRMALPRLTHLIETRLPPQTATIFTSSIPFQMLEARYDARVADRMQRFFVPIGLPVCKPDFSSAGGNKE